MCYILLVNKMVLYVDTEGLDIHVQCNHCSDLQVIAQNGISSRTSQQEDRADTVKYCDYILPCIRSF